jgi:hypothetical protein
MEQTSDRPQVSCVEGTQTFVVFPQYRRLEAGKLVSAAFSVVRSLDGGRTWTDVPLALNWSSRFRHLILATSRWPPEYVDRAFMRHGKLIVEFRDPWFPFDRQPPAGSSEREGEWRATYSPEKRRWSLERLRTLDYERADTPPPAGSIRN